MKRGFKLKIYAGFYCISLYTVFKRQVVISADTIP